MKEKIRRMSPAALGLLKKMQSENIFIMSNGTFGNTRYTIGFGYEHVDKRVIDTLKSLGLIVHDKDAYILSDLGKQF